ncbi:hypothetical protein AX769_08555 [Frondihabitans sp. PAMC 28766]|uniref:maltokinase N-terminal cap-like domain-containing protein n=1 Tax=Frondihabitans sp. PAMC 28766 TaxID=1795630 RepID=UPI00078CFE32|nr:hypothetical protein [Frondihabitans sp. PAMC 28766]AMM20206.1 hypothetical protein AX769_08555 [Frondihabitans sp. PAMC 28766]
MALLHKSVLTPSKTAVIDTWAKARPWFRGDADAAFVKVAAFRFDDPDGRVGLETLFVTAGAGPVLQVPLTYRDTALDGGEAWLLGTLEHSVLGTRYVYDGLGDPAYLAALATAALAGGPQAEEFYEVDGDREVREPSAVVAGSGSPSALPVDVPAVSSMKTRDDGDVSVTSAGPLTVALARVPGAAASALAQAVDAAAAEREVLTGTWAGHDAPATLALVARASR